MNGKVEQRQSKQADRLLQMHGLMSKDTDLAQLESDVNSDIPWIAERTKQARFIGLDMEVIYFSLAALKMNPKLTVREAVDAACKEWDV